MREVEEAMGKEKKKSKEGEEGRKKMGKKQEMSGQRDHT